MPSKMYKNGVARPSRRQDGDSSPETEIESRRTLPRQNRIRQLPKAASQHPQQKHVGNKNALIDERIGKADGGYGSVTQQATAASRVTAPSPPSWIQHAQRLFSHRPDPFIVNPPPQPPLGKPYQRSYQHQNGLPPSPPPQKHLRGDQNPEMRMPMTSSHQFSVDSMLYYSDEEDSAIEVVGNRPPIMEFSTLLAPQTTDADGRSIPSNRRNLMTKMLSAGDLSDSDEAPLVEGTNNHRRNSSDFLFQGQPSSHRRTNSAEIVTQQKRFAEVSNDVTFLRDRSPLPLPLHPFHRKSTPTAQRARSYSGGPSKPHHKRGDSASSITSVASVLSEKSIVSDISRSVLYKKVTNTGKVTFHSPADKVRLVMDKDLQSGHLYRLQGGDDEEDRFFQYTLQSEDVVDFPLLEGTCGCECASCAKCQHKLDHFLYPSQYVLRVEDDLYQRVIGEISDSKQPCGLFFCGHHEDADKPSILIAIGIVVTFFGGLLVVTFLGNGD